MIPRKTITPPRLFVVFTLAILPVLSFGRAEPFVRPVAQYTWLPTSARDASRSHITTGGATPMGPLARIDSYTTESNGFGGGLAVGVAVGADNQFEIGVEGTLTRYDGTYKTTPLPYYEIVGSQAVLREGGPASLHSCTVTVRTVLSTFRQYFGKKPAKVRPYWALCLGTLDVEFDGVELPKGSYNYDYRGDDLHLATGLGGGVLIRLGRKTYFEAGYRFLYATGENGLYRNAHTLNLALNQRF